MVSSSSLASYDDALSEFPSLWQPASRISRSLSPSLSSESEHAVSRTPIVNVTGVASLPAASSAVQVIVVDPTENAPPEAGVQLTVTLESILSDAPGSVYVTTTPLLVVAVAYISAWHREFLQVPASRL